MRIVADTNTFLAVALDEPEREKIIQLTKGHELVAPEVLPFEIGNALTAMMKKNTLNPEELTLIWDTALMIPVELYRSDIRMALQVAVKFNIYAYDAYFVECAIRLRCPLLTLDRRLKSVARENGIKILD